MMQQIIKLNLKITLILYHFQFVQNNQLTNYKFTKNRFHVALDKPITFPFAHKQKE